MSSTHIDSLRHTFAGQMSEGEMQFCLETRALLQAILESRVKFEDGLQALLRDLRALRKHSFDVDAATKAGFTSATGAMIRAPSSVVAPKQQPAPAQLAFLKDMDGYLDFATRNGLNFTFVLMGIMHDVAGLADYGWDLERAEADPWMPKTSGWAARNVMPVGEPEE